MKKPKPKGNGGPYPIRTLICDIILLKYSNFYLSSVLWACDKHVRAAGRHGRGCLLTSQETGSRRRVDIPFKGTAPEPTKAKCQWYQHP